MAAVSIKTQVGSIDGTPHKRMFWSIISDYDLKTGVCELIDNALDIWLRGDTTKPPTIEVLLDVDRQLIEVKDDAGGVRREDLELLLAPGGSKNDPRNEVIGIFGVGGKRAGIALGETVEIKTRYGSLESFQLDITKEWLESDDWRLASYQIPNIEKRTTQVEISRLRRPFVGTDVGILRRHFGETYAAFIDQGCKIVLNGTEVEALSFEHWRYPPGFHPKHASFVVDFPSEGKVQVDIVVGLIGDRVPEEDNYGTYFYCNDRLIVKEWKSRDVGYYNSQEAGVPHPDASLCRGIVRLRGPARLMPWNSAKNGINTAHPIFPDVRQTLAPLIGHFSTLSRRFKDDWDSAVFRYGRGMVEPIEQAPSGTSLRAHLPPLPQAKVASIEKLKSKNKAQIDRMPWTLGLVEAMGMLEIIERQNVETKNRINLILLDSNFEIALKEFIVHRDDHFPPHVYNDAKISQIFARRHLVISEVTSKVTIPKELIKKAQHYYNLRNKLIHERATVDVSERDIRNYRSVVAKILKLLFDLNFPKT